MSILALDSYRDVIQLKLQENAKVRGYRSRLSEALKIQKSYFSQVMSGTADLTPDQAANLADFWLLDKRESEFLIALVALERAATPSLKAKIHERIDEIRARDQALGPMLPRGFEMDIRHAMKYCSKWYYGFVRAALYVPGLQTACALSKRLDLPLNLLETILHEMEGMGLVARNGDNWESVGDGFYLQDKTLREMVLREIRNKAVDEYASGNSDGIHYVTVGTISKKQFHEIKQFLSDTIDKLETEIDRTDGHEEEVMAVSMDFFRIGRT